MKPTRLPGAAVAGGTAVVSGVSVFVNSYGVHAVRQAAVYTTAKNAVAALLLLAAVGALRLRTARRGRRSARVPLRADTPARDRAGLGGARARLGLGYVGVVGGGVAFILFFTGLAHMTAEPAAFLHDTLVVWVAVLAWPVLRERLSGWNVLAIALLVGGQVAVTGGPGHLVAGRGAVLVLAATVLWAVETVVAKRLLEGGLSPATLACARMGIGVVALVTYVVATGHGGMLVRLDARQLGWTLATGALLAAYVATWMAALARARALDVTSVLVGSVVVTSLLDAVVHHSPLAPRAAGLVMVAAGAALVALAWPRRTVVAT